MGLTAITKGTNLTKKEKAANRVLFLKEEGVNDKINSIAKSMGVSPDEILYAIEKETAGSYSPSQKNLAGGSAVGLIQFVGTGTDKGKGGKTVNGTFYKSKDLEKMTTLEQLDVVEGYFIENFKKKGGKPGQIYNSIAAPSSVGKDGSKVIYAPGSAEANQNPGWQNEDGSVTTDSIARFGGTEEFFTYTPRTLSSSTNIEQPITAEDKLTQTRQKQKDKEALLNSKYKLTSEEEEEVKNAAIETASDIQARIERGELDGSDDEIKNLYFKELAKKIGVVDIDVNDANALSRARGFIEHATSISNEELGEQVGGDQFIDSKIEDALENWSNNVNWNLENLGIPKKGQLTVNEPLFTGSVSVPGSVSTESEPQETPPDVQLKDIIKQDSKLVEEAAKTGLTAEQLADKKLQEKKYPNRSLDEAAQNLEDLDIQEEEEEEESMESLGLKEDGTPLEPTDTDSTDDNESKINGAEKALTGLKAAAGILSLSQALRAPDVETPEISPLVTEALHKQKALAESGLTAKEKGAAMQNLNDAYAGAMKNVLRASGGQRGMFLANQGTVDANRIKGLNQLAAQDAALHRQNIGQYNQLASSVGSMKLSRDMNVEQMRQATLSNNRQILSGVGSNLLSDAISDVSYYMNPNREKTQALLDQLSKGQNADTSGFDSSVGTANTDPTNQKQVDKDQIANQKKTNV